MTVITHLVRGLFLLRPLATSAKGTPDAKRGGALSEPSVRAHVYENELVRGIDREGHCDSALQLATLI